MGLFSSIKKAVSKTWGGIKKTVKTVARTVKKVAKKVAYAVPGGKALWKLGTKVGQGIMKGIGKITSKLGPIGTMALSFVLAPVIGPALGALWSGFGAGAAGMAASSNMLVSALGNVGTGVFAAGNFVGGTLGALGNAVTEGASHVMSGNFSAAANSFATNISNAFTGKAGMAAVNAGAAQAAQAAGELVGTTNPMAPVDPSTMDPTAFKPTEFGLDNVGERMADSLAKPNFNVNSLADQALYGKDVAAMTLTDQHAFMNFGAEGVKAINAPVPIERSFSETMTKVADNASTVGSLLGGNKEQSGYQPYEVKPIQSTIAKAASTSGQGSAGFSLLGGVQGLEESLRRSQSMMFG